MTVLPRSLTGRLAMVLALALMAAQAVSFALMARAQDRFNAERAAFAAVIPIAASLSADRDDLPPRLARRRARFGERRVQVAEAPPEGDRLRRVERSVAEALTARGIEAGAVRVVRTADDRPQIEGRGSRPGGLLVSVRREDGRWLTASGPPPRHSGRGLGPLALQTALIYVVLLAPVLWIGRQVARPLAELSAAVRDYRFGDAPAALPSGAPEDVAHLARSIAAMQARVAAAAEERDAMLGAVGHDLRTPLTSLRLRAEQVADEALRDKMVATIARTQALLEDALALARAGRPDGEAVPTDLAALAKRVVETARAGGERATLGALEDVTARVHPAALSRALANLVANAHVHAGGGTVTLRSGDGEAVLAVTDEGPGLPDGFVPGAFSRGEASRNRATGGAGLGLAIARRIAEAHRGRLDLIPRPGGGTVAAISLPLSPTPGDPGAADGRDGLV